MLPVEAPKHLILTNYAENYQGRSICSLIEILLTFIYLGSIKIKRLIFVGDCCSALQIEAYQLALKEIKENTQDVNRYIQVLQKLNCALEAHGQPLIKQDDVWI
jgi:hypothetical protein